MRLVPLTLSSLLCVQFLSLAAPNVNQPGVPQGWSALQYDNYGNDILNKGRYAEARKYFDAAIRVEPSRWTAYYNRAVAFRKEKNWNAAINDLNQTIRLQPAFFMASWERAIIYQTIGNYAAALKDLNALTSVTFQTTNQYGMALALNWRASLRATCPDASFRDGKVAVQDAKRACEMSKWKYADYIDTLAAAYAESGDFDSAVRYEQQAIDLNRSGKDETLQKTDYPGSDKLAVKMAEIAQKALPEYFKRLELYKHHHPYRSATKR
ncbi:MAG TPA: tetratricopeptide repeat protein [Chthoniobacterales bacterium]|nr:tetratricopeptide repeat protein [Chthoniobacterales bacterium]